MRVIINQVEYELPSQSVITDALSMIDAKPPYAVAVNLNFVPKTKHIEFRLNENDQIEVIAPVTGG
ncbi:thiamine biosynthesis protein ThiS [Polynucleobacter asymbioticus]|jgi:sulfur carrier protein|uniref:Sulfur carrier protein ThiS n=1 Tax=Polynucleobacter asymbioticus (strain DSM 18221 / CIP 109841 / QLW-P1DMWA-1) TaxID=312153 RepID=A4SX96_POLAQ|nr:sulfur carrier protein ThiS [Polynucleobacter asymbioticus]ABP34110.1 sulfur carrier protein ThiS [Polynucleobacter asymbioticus QLW-P1DMWA-1]APB98769.1 thiamine biosynthesis protein ThiS [Polynucleobacter asymbioticus]APC05959.1 thiamine biosynthesis protein ThiS [Polynucleobacter asymbioticus]